MNRRERETWLMVQWARRRLAAREAHALSEREAPCAPAATTRSVARQNQLRRSAAAVDMQVARCSRWTDTVGLLNGCAPQYLVPLLAYAVGMGNGLSVGCSAEEGAVESEEPPGPDAPPL